MAETKKRNKIIQIVKLLRPVHWIKNMSLFAALIFSGTLLDSGLFFRVVYAFILYNMATSATYALNDILDAKLDRLHPIKRFRPIASGAVSKGEGLIIYFVLMLSSLYLSFTFNFIFFILVLSYLGLQFLYSVWLKNVPIVDILVIATGFIIRIYSGAIVIDAHLSVWFLLCVISAALYIASGKRRAELNSIESTKETTRLSLTKYRRELLNSYVTMFGNAAWMSWALFTFFESPKAPADLWLFLAELSKTTTVDKLLMSTIPVSIFAIMRYQALIFRGETEAPEKLFLTDKALIVSIFTWILMVYLVIYGDINPIIIFKS